MQKDAEFNAESRRPSVKTPLKKMRQDETRKDAIDFRNFQQKQISKVVLLRWNGFLDDKQLLE